MSTIGSIGVNVFADVSRFTSGMSKARRSALSFGGTAAYLKQTMLGLASAFAVGFSIREITKTIGELDDLADAAKRLGTTAKQLAGLKHAAFMEDTDFGQLNRALTIMEKNVANNAAAFRMMGLDTKRLKDLETVEMFILIADAINRMPTPAERTAAAMAAMGKAAPMQLIGTGREGIMAAMSEAESMGLAPSDEEMKNIQAADKALKSLAESVGALKVQAAVTLGPWIKDLAELVNVLLGGRGPAQRKWDQMVGSLPEGKFQQFSARSNAIDALTDAEARRFGASPDKGRFLSKEEAYKDIFGVASPGFHQGGDYFWDAVRQRQKLPPKSGLAGGARAGMPGGGGMSQAPGWLHPTPAAADLIGAGIDKVGSGIVDALTKAYAQAAAFIGRKPPSALPDLSPADIHRMSSAVDVALSNMAGPSRLAARSSGGSAAEGGFHALEAGTAEAFAQARRSAAQQTDPIPKMQLDEAKKQTKELSKIDAAIKAQQQLEVVNIA